MKKLEFLLKALEPIKDSKIDLAEKEISEFLIYLCGYKVSAVRKNEKWTGEVYHPSINSEGDLIWVYHSTISWGDIILTFDTSDEVYKKFDEYWYPKPISYGIGSYHNKKMDIVDLLNKENPL